MSCVLHWRKCNFEAQDISRDESECRVQQSLSIIEM